MPTAESMLSPDKSVQSIPAEGLLSVDLEQLDDSEYLRVSHEFGEQYKQLLAGAVDAEGKPEENELTAQFRSALEPYVKPLEGLSDTEVAAALVNGHRRAYNDLLKRHDTKPAFVPEETTAEDLADVQAVSRTAYGIPVLHTDNNRALFKHDGSDFCDSGLLLEIGLPPMVVVGNHSSATQKHRNISHETSHAVWSIMEGAGMIPSPDEGRRTTDYQGVFAMARDEAAAMQAAGQGGFAHRTVINYLRQDGYDEAFTQRYVDASQRYTAATVWAQGFEDSDAVLGYMQARNWDDFFRHTERMTRIAEALPHATPPETDSQTSWGRL